MVKTPPRRLCDRFGQFDDQQRVAIGLLDLARRQPGRTVGRSRRQLTRGLSAESGEFYAVDGSIADEVGQ